MFSFLRPTQTESRPSIAEVADLLAQERLVLIDVREVAEAKASGVAKGARLIPLSLLGLKADPKHPDCDLPHGLPVAVYCASGGRSAMAADVLARLGYAPVHNLGGLRDWAAGGGQIVAY
ncbi:MAG: rhodanese-like domain-containing protein [Tabrizicola sp.]